MSTVNNGLDPETALAIERALAAAELRPGDATSTVVLVDAEPSAVEDGGDAGDGAD